MASLLPQNRISVYRLCASIATFLAALKLAWSATVGKQLSLSQNVDERSIRTYYRNRAPNWRNHPVASLHAIHNHADLLPAWYGNSSRAGHSPYDFVPRPLMAGEDKVQMLFLLDFKDYLERMNSHSYDIVDAALRHPRVEVDVWGEGWAGWDPTLTLSANLAARKPAQADMPGCSRYDLVWSVSNYPRSSSPQSDALGCNTLHYHQLGDCHNDECIRDLFIGTSNITSTKYAFELLDMLSHGRLDERYPDSPMQLYSHSPDAANPWDYFPLTNCSEKQYDAVLFGADYDLYTIRPVVRHALDRNRTFITRFSHPGFGISRGKIPKKKLATYMPGHPSYYPQVQKRREFAEGLRNARICIFDSSMEKKAIRKYAQAFLSGCVVAADLPTEQEEDFRNFVIVLRPTASIEEINTVIYEALANPAELQEKALAAFAYAREHLTNTRKVDRLLRDAELYRQVSFIYPPFKRIEQERCANGATECARLQVYVFNVLAMQEVLAIHRALVPRPQKVSANFQRKPASSVTEAIACPL